MNGHARVRSVRAGTHRHTNRAFLVLLFITAAFASCGADSSAVDTVTFNPVAEDNELTSASEEDAETALPSETGTPDATAGFDAPEVPTCEVEVVEDEYGFQVEISSCDDEAVAGAPTSYLTLDEFIGSTAARTLIAGIRDRLILQSGCVNGVIEGVELTPGPAVRDAALSIPDQAFADAVTNLFNALSAADDVCDDATEWTTVTRTALAEMQQLEAMLTSSPGQLLEARPGEDEDITLLTADAVAHYDRLYILLTNVKAIEGSDLWYSSNHLAHVRGIRAMVAKGEEPDVIVIGSSSMARGVDPFLLTEATGLSVVNASMAGSPVPIHAREMDHILTVMETPTTIVWGEISHRYFRANCALPELEEIDERLATQVGAFSGVDNPTGANPLDLLFGSDPLNPIYADTPILANAENFGPWDRGYELPIPAAPNGATLTEEAETFHSGLYEDPVACDAQVDFASKTIERWTAEGHTVIAIAAPIANELAALHPDGGRAAHDAVNATLEAEYSAAGATFLDMSALLGPGTFADPLHANDAGRQLFTQTIAEKLQLMNP